LNGQHALTLSSSLYKHVSKDHIQHLFFNQWFLKMEKSWNSLHKLAFLLFFLIIATGMMPKSKSLLNFLYTIFFFSFQFFFNVYYNFAIKHFLMFYVFFFLFRFADICMASESLIVRQDQPCKTTEDCFDVLHCPYPLRAPKCIEGRCECQMAPSNTIE
jgi:hypothetical protein